MSNILDYLKWRGDVEFARSPFNDVDSLLFSIIAQIDLSDVVPDKPGEMILFPEAADMYFRKTNGMPPSMGYIVPDAIYDAFYGMMKSPRYAEVMLTCYVNDVDVGKEQQFAAYTAVLPERQGLFVAFRGTDDTLVGWKEDFNMSFMSIVPSQVQALKYIETVGRIKSVGKCPVYVGGHSKGGNLAVFSSAFCTEEVKSRIVRICCHDGPGFSKDMVATEDYSSIKDRVIRILPDTSVVGMLLENPAEMKVVKSTAKGLFQHDPFSWEVMCNDFVLADGVSEGSMIMKTTLDEWMEVSTPEQLSDIVNSLYVFLSSTESETLTQLRDNRKRLMTSLRQMPKQTRGSVLQVIKLMTGIESKKIKNELRNRFFKQGGTE